MPGSGKSMFASSLGPQINYDWYDLDTLIEESQGKTIREIFSEFGEDHFRQIEADVLRAVIADKDKFVLSCGGGTPCYHNNMGVLNQTGCSVFLDIDLKELVNRLGGTDFKIRPLINQHEKNLEQYLNDLLSQRRPFYAKAHLISDGTSSPQELIDSLSKPYRL